MRADAAENRSAIITAASDLWAEQGTDVSLRTIASAAGVGIGTLYRHFPSRDDLVVGVSTAIGDRLLALTEEFLHHPGWSDAPERTWIEFVCRDAELRIGALAPLLAEMAIQSPDIQQRIDPIRHAATGNIEEILALAHSHGLVHSDVSAMQFQLAIGVLTRPINPIAEKLVPEFESWILETFRSGLVPRP